MIFAAWAPLAAVLVLSYLLRHQEHAARQISTGALTLEYGTPWKIVGIAVGAGVVASDGAEHHDQADVGNVHQPGGGAAQLVRPFGVHASRMLLCGST